MTTLFSVSLPLLTDVYVSELGNPFHRITRKPRIKLLRLRGQTNKEEEEEEELLAMEEEAEIDRLPIDLLAHIFSLVTCFKDLAQCVLLFSILLVLLVFFFGFSQYLFFLNFFFWVELLYVSFLECA